MSVQGWKTVTSGLGWRLLAWRWCYFTASGSLCGRWGPVQTPDGQIHPRLQKRWRAELSPAEEPDACEKCLAAKRQAGEEPR